MLYKGYRIRTTNFQHQQYCYRIYLDDKEIAFKGYILDSQKALELAKKEVDAIISNPYTPNNRPPYMWIPVENDLPNDWSHVLAVWTDGTHKMLAKSYCSVGWTCLEYPQLNNGDWYVIYWQYMPALP